MVNLKKVAVVITVGLLVTGCVSRASYRKLETKYNTDVTAMSAHIKDLSEANKTVDQDNKGLVFELQKTKLENEKLKHEAKIDNDTISRMKEKIMKRLQGIADDDVSIGPDGRAIIKGDVLFSPGEANLKQKGKEILNKIAEIIKSEPGYLMQISGHTDSDPITRSIDRWTTKSNFELAAYRALAVLLHLEDQGVDPSRMFLVSFGEHRPKGAKKSDNRRVEISFIGTESEEKAKEEPAPSEDEAAPVSNEPSK